jgi:hypothetical protein
LDIGREAKDTQLCTSEKVKVPYALPATPDTILPQHTVKYGRKVLRFIPGTSDWISYRIVTPSQHYLPPYVRSFWYLFQPMEGDGGSEIYNERWRFQG